MMNLATIEKIDSIEPHPNADRLDLAMVGNYKCIVGKDSFKPNDLCVLIKPDSVLPDQPWAEPYKKFCKNRVKAAKIRDVWSFGIVVSLKEVGLVVEPEIHRTDLFNKLLEIGINVTDNLGIKKYVSETENQLDVREVFLNET